MTAELRSIPGICEVRSFAGSANHHVLIEVPHGATLAAHFDTTLEGLEAEYRPELRDFFFVNTDVGAPELALAIAERTAPKASVTVIRCLIPRTFVDCNRIIDRQQRRSQPGQVTPGLHVWVEHERDQERLLDLHQAYLELLDQAYEHACDRSGDSGLALMLHSYAPVSYTHLTLPTILLV